MDDRPVSQIFSNHIKWYTDTDTGGQGDNIIKTKKTLLFLSFFVWRIDEDDFSPKIYSFLLYIQLLFFWWYWEHEIMSWLISTPQDKEEKQWSLSMAHNLCQVT